MKLFKRVLLLLSWVLFIFSSEFMLLLLETPVNAWANCGSNTCNTYRDSSGVWNYVLSCSQKYNPGCGSGLNDKIGFEYTPAACGSGSYIINHVTCSTNKKSVTWSYYCSSADNGQGEIRTKVIANSDCSDSGGGGGGACAPTNCGQVQFAECCTFDYSMCSCN